MSNMKDLKVIYRFNGEKYSTLYPLAEKLNVSPTTVSGWIRQKKVINGNRIYKTHVLGSETLKEKKSDD